MSDEWGAMRQPWFALRHINVYPNGMQCGSPIRHAGSEKARRRITNSFCTLASTVGEVYVVDGGRVAEANEMKIRTEVWFLVSRATGHGLRLS